MSCNCSAPMIGGRRSKRRYQIGKTKLRSSSRIKNGGGWFSSLLGSSDNESEEKKDEGGFFGMFGKSSSPSSDRYTLPQTQDGMRMSQWGQSSYASPARTDWTSQMSSRAPTQIAAVGGSRRRSRRRGGRHCKTSKYRLGGRHRKNHK